MKLLAYFIAVAILIVVLFQPDGFSWRNLLSLNNPIAQKTTPSPVVVDTLEVEEEDFDDLEMEVDSMVLLEQERSAKADSLLFSNTLDSVLLLAKANWNTAWSGQGRDTSNGAYNTVWWEARQGNLFSDTDKHLIIRRSGGVWDDTHLDIYKVHKDSFTHLLHHLQDEMSYVSDTIMDINGDRLLDFVVNWTSGSGQSTNKNETIYLQKGARHFSYDFSFVNAVYAPDQKAVYGLKQNALGNPKLYYYQWTDDFRIDTIEYLYINNKDSSNITYSSVREGVSTQLNSIPKNYEILKPSGYYYYFNGYR